MLQYRMIYVSASYNVEHSIYLCESYFGIKDERRPRGGCEDIGTCVFDVQVNTCDGCNHDANLSMMIAPRCSSEKAITIKSTTVAIRVQNDDDQ